MFRKNTFYNLIKDAKDERAVESPYKEGLLLYFPNVPYEYPFKCDGYMEGKIEGKTFRLIIEYKLDELLNDKAGQAKVLIQVVWYLKKFEEDGKVIPNVCLVGDKNECFALHTNPLQKYLDSSEVDWKIAPSEAHKKYPSILKAIAEDKDISPFVFEINEKFSFQSVAEKIRDLAQGVQRYVRITEHNISNIYDYFCRNVLKQTSKQLSPHELVDIFIGTIFQKDNYFLHPNKHNTLVCKDKSINIDAKAFQSFCGYFDRDYRPEEKNRITSIADRLLEDTERRCNGDFWTPTLFVDYAHRRLEEVLGNDWKENYVVWDNCWGTGNLTRDYRFKELYCSTNMQEELNLGERYNKESVKFQFDFLNDFIPSPNIIQYNTKLPQGLLEALRENKPIVFFLNPPYARAGKSEEGEGTMGTMKGTAKTSINAIMKQEKIGACSANLYAQFLYRIAKIKQEYNLTHVHIALYSPTLFLTGSSWEGFRKFFFKEFDFCQGVQFNAAYFSNVKSTWGISFSIWKNGETQNKNSFPYDLIEEKEGEIQIIGKKTIYNLDGEISVNDWIQTDIKRDSQILTMKSALKIGSKILYGNKDLIGWLTNGNNSINFNSSEVYMMSRPNDRGKTNTPITPENFTKCTALFAARKLIACDWINSKDEYLAPNEENPHYNEFVEDSVVFSLFHSSSNQSSLRNIDYKGKKWNIKNEFFFMSRKDIMSLANENDNEECYEDAKIESTERFVYLYLKGKKLSQEANAVLEKAIEIVKLTFPYRGLFNDSNPNYQVMNWDSGWYQIKAIAEEYANKEYEEFRKLFLLLAKKMRPLVYELGFLKK